MKQGIVHNRGVDHSSRGKIYCSGKGVPHHCTCPVVQMNRSNVLRKEPTTVSVSAITATVVMPCHNGAQFLGAAVQSVLAQSWPQIQLLVVDDGSSDGSGAILASIRRAQASVRVLTQNHKGAYSARNRALRLAEGELVAFLDADDLWSPQFLETMTNELLYNNADLVRDGY